MSPAFANAAGPSERLARIRALRDQGDLGAAERLMIKFLEDHPGHAAGRHLFGEMLADRGAWEEAAAAIGDLSGETLGYPLYHLRGKVALERGDPEAARRDLQQALRIRPGHAADLFLLGRTHARARRWALAIESYNRAVRAGLDDVAVHLALARAYLNLGVTVGEVSAPKLGGAGVGTIVDRMYVLESVPGREGTFRVCSSESAVYHVAAARERGAKGRETDELEADVWLAAGYFDRARTLYAKAEPDEAARHDPRFASFYERFGRACLGLGDFDQGLRLLRTAVKLDAKTYSAALAEAHVTASERASVDGDLKRALYHLRQAVDAAPDDADLHRRLGDAYEQQGDRGRAGEHWRKVLQLQPDHPSRIELLDKIQQAATDGKP